MRTRSKRPRPAWGCILSGGSAVLVAVTPLVPPRVLGQGTSPPCLSFPVCGVGRRVSLWPGGDNALSPCQSPSGPVLWGDSAGAAPVPEGTWRWGQPPGKASDIPSPLLAAPALYCTRRCGCRRGTAGPGEPRRARCVNDPDR